MPAMASISIFKADGTTSQTLTAVTAASGDGSAARWRLESVGATPAVMPTVEMSSRWNGPKTARRVNISVVYPYAVVDTSGVSRVVERCVYKDGSSLVPLGVPQAVADEFVTVVRLFINSSLCQQSMKSGYAPN